MVFLIRWAVNTISLGVAVIIVKGVVVKGIFSLVVASLVIGFLNASLKPVMLILTLPLNLLTMGMFTLFINTIMILIAAEIVRGFYVTNFWAAFTASILMSIVSFLLSVFIVRRGEE